MSVEEAEPGLTETERERRRCERIAESVMIAARNWLSAGRWSESAQAAWEARQRAASDILTSIRSGIDPR